MPDNKDDDFDKFVTPAAPHRPRAQPRTDRHNNPIAVAVGSGGKNQFTKALDDAEIDWEPGDPFPSNEGGASMRTIRIKGDGFEGARAILSNTNAIQSWYSKSTGKNILPKYGVRTNHDFRSLPVARQNEIINGIYQSEGGRGMLKPAPDDDFDKFVSRPQSDDGFDKHVTGSVQGVSSGQPLFPNTPAKSVFSPPSNIKLGTNDTEWHFGENLPNPSPRAMKVLRDAVAEDARKKAAGEAIAPPSPAYQAEMRRRAGLQPLSVGSSRADLERESYRNTSIGELRQSEDEPVGFSRAGQPSRVTQTPDELRVMKGEQPLDRQAYSRQQDAQTRISEMKALGNDFDPKKQEQWRAVNQGAINLETEKYRRDIQQAKSVGGDAGQWLAEFGSKAGAGLAELGAGISGSDTLRIKAEAAARAAQEEGADRNVVSKFIQDAGAGLVSSAPELLAMKLGVSPAIAFSAGGAVRAGGSGRDPNKAALSGLGQAAAFDVPVPSALGEGVRGAIAKGVGTAGASTLSELAMGTPLKEAAVTGATTGLMRGVPEIAGAGGRGNAIETAAATDTTPHETNNRQRGVDDQVFPVEEVAAMAREANAQRINPQAENIGAAPTAVEQPQRFQHLQFGKVEVTDSQQGARAGRLRVAEVGNSEAIHYVKKSDLRGRGNERMVPLKPAELPNPSLKPSLPQPIIGDVTELPKGGLGNFNPTEVYNEPGADVKPEVTTPDLSFEDGLWWVKAGTSKAGFGTKAGAEKYYRDSIALPQGEVVKPKIQNSQLQTTESQQLNRLANTGNEAPELINAVPSSTPAVKEEGKPASEAVLTQALNPQGSGMHSVVAAIAKNPKWKAAFLKDLGEGAVALPNEGTYPQFRAANGDIITLRSTYKDPDFTYGDDFLGFKVEREKSKPEERPVEGRAARIVKQFREGIAEDIPLTNSEKLELADMYKRSDSPADRFARKRVESMIPPVESHLDADGYQRYFQTVKRTFPKFTDEQAHDWMAEHGIKGTGDSDVIDLTAADVDVSNELPSQVKTGKPEGRSGIESTVDKLGVVAAPTQTDLAQLAVPEKPETLRLQMEQLNQAKRPAVLFTPGEEIQPHRKGLIETQTDVGTWVHDPYKLKASEIRAKVADGTYHELLGIIEKKGVNTDRVVTARALDGTEIESAAVSPENEAAQAKIYQERSPDATIETGTGEDVINERQGSVTSIKNAALAADRAALTLSDLPAAEHKSWRKSLDEAQAKGLSGDYADRLAERILSRERTTINDEESAGLELRIRELQNQHQRLTEQVWKESDPDKIHDLVLDARDVEDQFNKLSDASKQAGSHIARALSFRRSAINENYDLAGLKRDFKVKTGKEPTGKNLAKIEGQAKEISRLNDLLKASEEKASRLEAENAVKRIQREITKEGRKQKAKTLDDEAVQIKNLISLAWKKNLRQQGTNPSILARLDPEGEILKLVLKLARNRVQKGTVTAEGLVDEIHGLLSDTVDGLTKRDVREMISGYGRTGTPRSELQKKIDALKSELYQGLKDEDIAAGRVEAPELKRAKTAAQNRINELKQMIADGKRTVRGKAEPLDHAEVKALHAERDTLQEVVDALDKPARDVARAASALESKLKTAKKAVAETQSKIDRADTSAKTRTAQPATPEIESVRAQNKLLNDILRDMRTSERRATREAAIDAGEITARKQGPQNTWPARQKAIEKQIAEIEQRIQARDFSEKTKRGKTVESAESQRILDRLEAKKNEYQNLKRRNSPGHWWTTASGIRKAWMLSGIKTHARNVVGTALYQPFDEAARLPAVIIDAAMAPMTNQRSISGPSPAAMIDSILHAAKVGGRKASEILKQGATREDMERHQFQEINTGVKVIDTVHNAVFRVMSASDKIFYEGAYRRNLLDRALVEARNEARNDPKVNVRTRAKELSDSPTQDLDVSAKHDALVSTYNNNNRLSDSIKRARSAFGPATNFAIDLVMPFDRTPTNVIARILEASPVGFAKAATGGYKGSPLKVAKSIIDGSMTREDQRQFAQTIGRATTGTAIIGLGWYLGGKVLTTDDKGNVFLNVRGHKINVSQLSPIGNLFAIGARMRDEFDKGTLTPWSTAKIAGRVPLDQPLLRASSQVSEAVRDPERSAGKTGASTAFSFVPFSGAVRMIGEAKDPAESRYADKSFKQQFQRNVPVWRQSLPETNEKQARQSTIEKMRKGDVPSDSELRSQGYTTAQITEMKKDAKLSSFQVAFSNAQAEQSLDRYERMSEFQRFQVKKMMEHKAWTLRERASYLLTNTKPEDKSKRQEEYDTLMKRLKDADIVPVNPKRHSNPFKIGEIPAIK